MTTRTQCIAGLDQLGPKHSRQDVFQPMPPMEVSLAHRIHISQALRRKRPVTLPKVNLDRD